MSYLTTWKSTLEHSLDKMLDSYKSLYEAKIAGVH